MTDYYVLIFFWSARYWKDAVNGLEPLMRKLVGVNGFH